RAGAACHRLADACEIANTSKFANTCEFAKRRIGREPDPNRSAAARGVSKAVACRAVARDSASRARGVVAASRK
ncbi:MAG TPA: hypothetical protein VE087_00610, partial [Xanthobacteraceae bacterium]|nr:hypothetical protein [Xanthobacteraceae bacterium]